MPNKTDQNESDQNAIPHNDAQNDAQQNDFRLMPIVMVYLMFSQVSKLIFWLHSSPFHPSLQY